MLGMGCRESSSAIEQRASMLAAQLTCAVCHGQLCIDGLCASSFRGKGYPYSPQSEGLNSIDAVHRVQLTPVSSQSSERGQREAGGCIIAWPILGLLTSKLCMVGQGAHVWRELHHMSDRQRAVSAVQVPTAGQSQGFEGGKGEAEGRTIAWPIFKPDA